MDRPLINPDDDRFQRWSFAQGVARTIVTRESTDPLVVGIFGPWGDGKTTVLNFVERAIGELGDGTDGVIRFNPWRYTDEQALLEQFFTVLGKEIGAKLKTKRDEFADLLRDYGAGLAAVLGRSQDVGALADVISNTSVDELRSRIEGELSAHTGAVAVLVDDIDRLRRRDVQLLFRLVALTADFPRITYVLAFDPEVIADALTEEYGYEDKAAGRKFLEKIVHVPLPLPQVEQAELRQICAEGVDAALRKNDMVPSEKEANQLARDFANCVEPVLQTARTAKRLGRVLEFLLPLVKNEVNAADFVLMEALHVFFPPVYGALTNRPGFLVPAFAGLIMDEDAHKRDGAAFFESVLSTYPGNEREALQKLLARLFPQAVGLSEPSWPSGDRASWLRDQRVCSEEYFLRYLTYSVRPGDLADANLAVVLLLAAEPAPGFEAELHKLLEATPDRTLLKLRARAGMLQADQAKNVMVGIARSAPCFQVEWPLFSIRLKPLSMAAVLVLELLRTIEKEDRHNALMDALAQCPVPEFTHEVFRWLTNPEARDLNHDLLFGESLERLAEELVEVVRHLASADAYFPAAVPGATRLLSHWANHTDGEVKPYLEKAFSEDPKRIEDFITRFMSRTTGDDDINTVVLVDFEPDSYESLAAMVDVDVFAEQVADHFGLIPAECVYSEDRSVKPARRAATQFLAVHSLRSEGDTGVDGDT